MHCVQPCQSVPSPPSQDTIASSGDAPHPRDVIRVGLEDNQTGVDSGTLSGGDAASETDKKGPPRYTHRPPYRCVCFLCNVVLMMCVVGVFSLV